MVSPLNLVLVGGQWCLPDISDRCTAGAYLADTLSVKLLEFILLVHNFFRSLHTMIVGETINFICLIIDC